MNNPIKLILGILIGAGVGAGVTRLATSDSAPEQPVMPSSDDRPRETLKERWSRAQATGEAAKAAKEEELRAYFRTRVKDQQAMRENPTL